MKKANPTTVGQLPHVNFEYGIVGIILIHPSSIITQIDIT